MFFWHDENRQFFKTMITRDQIAKIAHLSRLGLSDAEIDKYTQELSDILGFFEKLQEVDTENVEPVAQITGLENIARADEAVPSEHADQLLDCSPQSVVNRQIKVSKAI
jgi:aspartyl-tRNA(Asn)/glutamyl-tRNA(Gln) amidotransferase subunit C